MRTFIAVDIPEDIKNTIGDYIKVIRNEFGDSVKWVYPKNLHFTIKFLGDVEESQVPILEECVSRAASEIGRFSIELDGVGYFPSEQKPRVIWLGADSGADNLLEIYQDLETCLEEHGYDREPRPFSPHLTIGRVKKHKFFNTPGRIAEFEPVQFEASGLALIKSTLTPSGPVYEKMFESVFDGVMT